LSELGKSSQKFPPSSSPITIQQDSGEENICRDQDQFQARNPKKQSPIKSYTHTLNSRQPPKPTNHQSGGSDTTHQGENKILNPGSRYGCQPCRNLYLLQAVPHSAHQRSDFPGGGPAVVELGRFRFGINPDTIFSDCWNIL